MFAGRTGSTGQHLVLNDRLIRLGLPRICLRSILPRWITWYEEPDTGEWVWHQTVSADHQGKSAFLQRFYIAVKLRLQFIVILRVDPVIKVSRSKGIIMSKELIAILGGYLLLSAVLCLWAWYLL